MTKNTTPVNASVKNDVVEVMLQVMGRMGERNASHYVGAAIEAYNKVKTEELNRKDKVIFMLEKAKPLLRDYFRSIRVDHIPDDYVFITDGTLKKVQKYLKEHNAEIDVQIIKDAILELTMEESQ